MKTVFVALIQIPYEGERFVGVYSTKQLAEKALLQKWERLAVEAELVVSQIQIDGNNDENIINFWKVKLPEKQWKEW
ncbi:MAG: hypothetical protein ACKPE3_13290 [Sphaerospermopsis kisseleviana]